MKTLLVWVACVYSVAASFPRCWGNNHDVCVAREVKDLDRWASKDYIVNGVRMSVAVSGDDVRWSCAGNDPTKYPAPGYEIYFAAKTVELIDCKFTVASFGELFEDLALTVSSVRGLTIKSRPQHSQWPTADELRTIEDNNGTNWVAATAKFIDANYLDSLSLQGVPMSLGQLISVHNIKTLILKDTGLTKVMNLSEFTKLHRLELHEPMLEDAVLLNTLTALEELVLHAPDAGLASMPSLRQATFKEVYMIGSIFGHCQNLTELTLEGGELDHIPEHWLAGCTALWQLKLMQLKNLFYLPNDLLTDTTSLRYLDLSHNSLASLPEGLFSKAENLEILKLNHNYLTNLPNDMLPGPTSLEFLCVSNNPQALFRKLQHLEDDRKPRGLLYNHCDNL